MKKILFIYPSAYDAQGKLLKSEKSFIPSRTLPYLAALTPNRYKIRIVDELIDHVDFNENTDLVVFTGMLRHIPRSIHIANEFRKRGIPTIIGGVGAFAVRDQIKESKAFSSHVIGEADQVWTHILDDFEMNNLKDSYECVAPLELNNLPRARFELLNTKKYMNAFWDRKHPIIPIETSRGCPRNCSFCLVTRYFGKHLRYRPISEVVQEIKAQGSKFVLFTDDNIAVNRARAKELFSALIPLNIQWLGQFEVSIAECPELLSLAQKSGCASALVGIESLADSNLKSVNKMGNIKFDFKEVVKAFNKSDIPLIASLIFGLDGDTPDQIDWTIEEMIKSEVDAILPWILTPVPGTPCYDEFKREGRLIHENYSLYDHWHVVMQPKQMTQEQLNTAFWRGLKRFYSMPLILKRFWPPELSAIPGLLYHVYFCFKVRKGMHPLDSVL